MTCHVSIQYPNTLDLIAFRQDVAEHIALSGARMLVHDIVNEKQPHDEDVADPELYYKFDNNIVQRNDIYEQVALVPRAKHLIQDALVDKLKAIFLEAIDEKVNPFSQADRDNGIPGDVVDRTPVMLRATNADELLTFVFSADLNMINADDQPLWQNVTVEISYNPGRI